jgi:GT2 family glycosyltransferase
VSEAISVIICTCSLDRWLDTCEAVDAARDQRPRVDEIIIVVDHNAELLARLEGRYAELSVIPNTRAKGLSGARNAGVAAARGKWLAFFDDDAIPASDCVALMCRHFADPDVQGVTSRIAPQWENRRPAWFPDEFLWVVGCSRPDATSGPVRNLIGASMCLSREVFARVGGFHPLLGRSHGPIPMGCEETELCIRLKAGVPGAVLWYDAAAATAHKVRAERLTFRYFARRCYAEGRSKAMLAAISGSLAWMATEQAYCTTVLPRGFLRGLADACLRGDLAGLARAFAIGLGLTWAAAGFLAGQSFAIVARWRGHGPVSAAHEKIPGMH